MSKEARIRVLVVDDSAFARKVLREVLARDPRLEVVDVARDGLDALEKIAALKPDVVTLDLVMPNLDGVGVLAALPKEDRPRVLVVSFSDADTELGAQALQLGALDIVKKPTALATDRMYELAGDLLEKVRALGDAGPEVSAQPAPQPVPEVAAAVAVSAQLVAVGTSTGGPPALSRLIAALPSNLPVPVVVALHIPAGYTGALAGRLDQASAIRVVEATEGMLLAPGTVVLAPGGLHLKVERGAEGLRAHLDLFPTELYTPSVDVLFESAAQATAGQLVAVVLTGMGDDGKVGAGKVRELGGKVLTESPESCVVYGMPRAVVEAGLSTGQFPLHQMAAAIVGAL